MKIRRSGRQGGAGRTLAVAGGLLAAGWVAVGAAVAGDYGTVTADTRVRYEAADIDGFQDADNLSARLRLGYVTPAWQSLQALVEGEFTGVADEDSYNAAGVHGDPSRAIIADPKNTELDQAYASYTNANVTLKVGRQAIALDNHRFIGDVGWRQNRQTFDAAGIRVAPVKDLQLYYGYVGRVVRIFGSEAPDTGANAGETDSQSHLINAACNATKGVKLTAYAYLLDLEDLLPASSVDTYGASVQAKLHDGDACKVDGRAEFARQVDAADNTADYEADYYLLSAEARALGLTVGAGFEVLGAENTGTLDPDGKPVYASFQTPLATLHKFNGFADRFLVTPPEGLEDRYASLGYEFKLPKAVGPLTATVVYHDFQSAEGDIDQGDEWDGVLAKPLVFKAVPGKFMAIAKLADYQKGDVGADTRRTSVEVNYGVTF